MASSNKRGKNSNNSNSADVTPVTEDFDEVALPGEEDEEIEMTDDTTVADVADETSTIKSAIDSGVESEAVAQTDITSDAAVDMVESEVKDLDAEAASLLDGENARIANDATVSAVVMRDVNDLPKDARIIKMQLEILSEYEGDYEALVEELRVGSSGKDEKVAHYIKGIDEEKDAPGYALVTKATSLAKQIEELQKLKDEADTELTTHVEAVLIATGNGDILTEEQIAAKKELIKAKYGEYKDQFAAAKQALDNYRTHKNPDAGEIHEYITHIPSPTGKKVNAAATGNAADKGGSRAVFVSEARYMNANGEWVRAFRTKDDKEFSNPTELAALIARTYDTMLKPVPLKDDMIAQWYIHMGTSVENVDRAKVSAAVAEFPFNFQLANGEYTSVPVRLIPRDFNATR